MDRKELLDAALAMMSLPLDPCQDLECAVSCAKDLLRAVDEACPPVFPSLDECQNDDAKFTVCLTADLDALVEAAEILWDNRTNEPLRVPGGTPRLSAQATMFNDLKNALKPFRKDA